MRVYDGENLKDTDPKAKSLQEYRDYAGVDEGMTGSVDALRLQDPVARCSTSITPRSPPTRCICMYVLEQQIDARAVLAGRLEQQVPRVHQGTTCSANYVEFIGKEIQTAYLESYAEYGQNIFDRYVTYADFWIQDQEYRDPDTGEMLDRAALNDELEKIEKPAGISNPKDFRNEIVNFVLRATRQQQRQEPVVDELREAAHVIEKKMFSNTEDLLPVICFNAKASEEEQKKHEDFVDSHGRQGLHAKAGALAVRVVSAGAEGSVALVSRPMAY